MKHINAIVAFDKDKGIAKDGRIPWNIRADKNWFDMNVAGDVVVVGRKTYERLPSRIIKSTFHTYVLSTTLDAQPYDNLTVVESKLDMKLLAFMSISKRPVWVIGGSSVYEHFLSYCSTLYVTEIDESYDCDRFFPEFENNFNEVNSMKLINTQSISAKIKKYINKNDEHILYK